jgi:hypothetical protein
MLVDDEAFVAGLERMALSGQHVDDLDERLLELDVGGVSEGCQAAAARRIEHDIRFDLDEHAVRDAGQERGSSMEWKLRQKFVLAGFSDTFAEELGHVELHGDTSRLEVAPV